MDIEHMTDNDAITINSAVDVLESAVAFEISIILAYKYPTQRKSLWERLLQIAGNNFKFANLYIHIILNLSK